MGVKTKSAVSLASSNKSGTPTPRESAANSRRTSVTTTGPARGKSSMFKSSASVYDVEADSKWAADADEEEKPTSASLFNRLASIKWRK